MYETLHILVIEDDPDTRSNLCDILSLDDYTVEAVATAREAFALRSWGTISVIILDRKLPDATAESLLPDIRRRAPNAAVIVVTGYADLDSTIAALRLGAYDYLLKPINPDALRATLVRIHEVREARHRAMQAERLAAIGQMITGLAHESRNALQRTQACLEMLRLEVEDRPEALDLCDRIQKAQDDLARLYDEVRNYAAPLQLSMEACDPKQIWRHAWRNLESEHAPKSLKLRENLSCAHPACYADPFALGQVFRNILENAVAASPPNGTIDVRCRDATLHGRAAIDISIHDEGPGIPEKLRERIFEPFFTTKTKGTGLGMAIARRIVEAHGGELRLRSGQGGATFSVILPCNEP